MKSKVKLLVLAIAMLTCAGVKAQNSNSEKTQAESKKDSVYYTCSMHPEIRSAVPGSCPKCGMDLIKQTAGQETQNKMPMNCGMMNMGNMDMNNNTAAKQDTVAYYTCSMHPDVKSDKPGNCPQCGMALVKATPAPAKKQKKHKMQMGGCGMM
ncbi:MAG TPA: heavy metal-binding domain-containing protein [Bacteroidia bacterium]|nr:heavy metal-binding domain-containing protein [Bacteroidia bacterium]HQK97499.1 heavy metal-binding domain-containing protein [Bacteroidia bacterium]